MYVNVGMLFEHELLLWGCISPGNGLYQWDWGLVIANLLRYEKMFNSCEKVLFFINRNFVILEEIQSILP